MVKVRSQFTYDHTKDPGHTFTEPSQTVPDQALSIEEILRFSRSGIDLGLSGQGYYDEDLGIDHFESAGFDEIEDLVDAAALRRSVESDISDISNIQDKQTGVAMADVADSPGVSTRQQLQDED